MLTVQNLKVSYRSRKRTVPVLSSVSLQAGADELVTLVGRNGAGKTTLLRSIVGLLKPDEGSVQLNGMELLRQDRRMLARMVSYVSTDMVYNPVMTVYDLVALGRHPHTSWLGRLEKTDRDSISRAITLTHMERFISSPVSELSDGERQRALIARALAQDTRLLIMDEPAAFLDVVNRYEIMMMLRTLCREEGKTVILSTHDLSLALHESDNIWLLLPGTCMQGAPEDLVLQDAFAALFEGSRAHIDTASGEVLPGHLPGKKVQVTGEGLAMDWTIRALDRMGYRAIAEPAPFSIEVSRNNNTFTWTLQKSKKQLTFKSIYELSLLLRNERF